MIPIAKPWIGQQEIDAVVSVLASGTIAQGPKVAELEKKIAGYCNVRHAVALNSGTAALHTALKVAGIGHGDEVITTPFTFIATVNTILMVGATPVFADISPDTLMINPQEIKKKITKKTKAIVTVDLYGQLCDYDAISEIARAHNLIIIEDACQAIGASWNGKMAGSFGDMAAFSCYATKNITCGEGGILTTNTQKFAHAAALFRQHGRTNLQHYDYNDVGYNYRMTDIQAAILCAQLDKVEHITAKRNEHAAYLTNHLKKSTWIQTPTIKKGNLSAFHQYTIKILPGTTHSREKVAAYLAKKGIASGIYYPLPLHLCTHIKKFGYAPGDFPVAEAMSEQVLSLPIFPQLTPAELQQIITAFEELDNNV